MLERIIETRSGKIVCIAFNKEFTDDMFLDYLWQWLHEYYGNLFSQDASAENQHFYFDINPENTGNKGNTLVNYRMWQRATQ